ncbi:hypothetical protein Hypma_000348 [Hypsizygus marmoreus]|uniref:Uncharacterized protein n=1 Tax=Hypsizygus marmoreus TaxID=39966 RepID=A0A369JDD1_HYPMA|nr:hypothetical protein Hypma_000348 [Hypsizygus marmoreus]
MQFSNRRMEGSAVLCCKINREAASTLSYDFELEPYVEGILKRYGCGLYLLGWRLGPLSSRSGSQNS